MDSSLMFSSGDNEHYTPYSFLLKVCEFYDGSIDLDPCSNSIEHPHCPAIAHYTKEMDGLALPWWGNVFLNPPYSRECLKPFIDKAIAEYESGNAKQILILVPARTDTQWHNSLKGYARCYLTGRLKFHNPNNKGNSAPFPSVLFYLGNNARYFSRYWADLGEVFIPLSEEKRERKREYMKEYMRRKRSKPDY